MMLVDGFKCIDTGGQNCLAILTIRHILCKINLTFSPVARSSQWGYAPRGALPGGGCSSHGRGGGGVQR